MKNLGAWALAGLLVIAAAAEMAFAQSGGSSGGQSGAASGSASGQRGTQGTDHSGDARREGMTGSNSAVQSGGSTPERSGAAMPGHPTTAPSSTATPGSGSVPGGDVLAEDTETVRHAQKQLQTAGFSAGPANGIMDEQTRNAIRQFQQAKGLNVTGALDTETRAALQAGAGTQTPANQVR
jgi:hypothetical protein